MQYLGGIIERPVCIRYIHILIRAIFNFDKQLEFSEHILDFGVLRVNSS